MANDMTFSAAEFDRLFPFHVGFRADGTVTQAGRSWSRLAPRVQPGAKLQDVLQTQDGAEPLTPAWAAARAGGACILREPGSQVLLRGQMQPVGADWLFLGAPWVDSTAALSRLGLTLDDFAAHDPTVDLLHLLELRRIASDDLKKLADRLGAQTERLRTKESETRKLALVAARTDNAVVITNPAGEIEWVNEGFTRMTGYRLAECAGRKPGSLLQGPATDPQLVTFMRERISRGEGFKTEIINYHKRGHSYWLAIEVQPIRDALGRLTNFMAIESDITERRRAQDNLRMQLGVARTLATALSIGEAGLATLRTIGMEKRWAVGILWLLNPDHGLLEHAEWWSDGDPAVDGFIGSIENRRFRRGEGLPGSAWETGTAEWLSDATTLPTFRPGGAAHVAGLRCGVAVPITRGERFLGVLEFFSRREEKVDGVRLETLSAVCSQFAQFLERMRAEEALREHSADLARANQELAQAARMKSVFLASMSHELRTPLTAILGLSETLLEQAYGPLNEPQAKYLRIVGTSGQHLLALINDLLDIAKIEAGQFELNRQLCSLHEVCASAVRTARELAAKRGQTVIYTNGAPPTSLEIDAQRITHVLNHLLANAAKFSAAGAEFGLEVSVGEVDVVLKVWDRGIGIGADDLPRIFQAFAQVDERLARKYAGVGLGLALVKHLVDLHGGRIEVASRLGAGSTFTITLPRKASGGGPL